MLLRLIACLTLIGCWPVHAGQPVSGLWFSPEHDGHGFDLQRAGDKFVVVFYTYTDDGQPVWYLAVATATDGLLSGTFNQFEYEESSIPPQRVVRDPGQFSIDFDSTGEGTACAGSEVALPGLPLAVFDWAMDGDQGSWCVTPLLPQETFRDGDLTGLWWAGPQDEGWGLSLDFATEGDRVTEVGVLFYFDSEGFPRWALGSTPDGGAVGSVPMQNFEGYCTGCPAVPLNTADAGRIDHSIESGEGAPAGKADLEIAYAFEPGGDWLRTGSPLILLSDPQPGLKPLPETVPAERTTVFEGVNLVPMTEGFPVIPDRDVLVRNGVIVSIDASGELEIPAEAEVIDGRGLYLAPGLSEMHLHITVGGQSAAEQAGLLMIANGVTTALNMGNSWTFDVPGLGRRFESGELIGPTFYAGQVAFGPGDDADDSLTVANADEATAYADSLKQEGFDYIKTYWQLPLTALRRFQTESVRLGLPLIGHIPLRQPMDQSMVHGHRMAAHIQEPYFSYMNQVRDDDLFLPAANVFKLFGAYLTPTLAVFESYVRISGNRADNYLALIQREGQQYQPISIRDAWQDYFERPFIRNGNAADLDNLLAFYYRMARFFFDAGVPMLIGTDAPGFPGVMSGFGAIEEMRLLHETGIPAADVFAMATRNAGDFVHDTLGPEVGFGTIREGHRADLILTRRNPLDSVEHVVRPLGVMARGRFWSQAFLQRQLDQLRVQLKTQNLDDPRYQNTETLDFHPHH